MISPWHKNSFQQLRKMFDANKLPHALLITGAESIGKLELAQQLVKSILCKDNGCGECKTCIAIDKDEPKKILTDDILVRRSHYQNMLYCTTESNNKGITSNNIKVDQVRSFCEALSKTADNLQVGILFYAEQMNINAANSLLKTLEEPRRNTLIILLAHNAKNLPATILSRCQNVHIAPSYTDDDTIDWIVSKLKDSSYSKPELTKLLKKFNGVPAKVVNDINNGSINAYKKYSAQLLSIADNPIKITQVQDFADNEEKVLECLQNIVIGGIKLKILNKDSALTAFNKIIKSSNLDFLFKLLDDIQVAIRLLKTSANSKLLLDDVLVVWSHITHLQQYPQIINNNYKT